MPLRLLVADPQELFRVGLVTTLQTAGFAVDETTRLTDIARLAGRPDVVVLVLRDAADLDAAAALVGDSPIPVVGLLDRAVADQGERALRGGLTSVLPTDAPAGVLSAVVELAGAGISAVPRRVVANLVSEAPVAPLTPDERNWLSELAAGHTVVELAVRHGWSERSLYRMLREVYGRLGAANRSEAVAIASRDGLL